MITNETERKQRPTFSLVEGATNTKVMKVTASYIRCMAAILPATIDIIRQGDASQKRNLPAICWAANFKDGKRHAESAEPTGLAYIDIDHITENMERLNMPAREVKSVAVNYKKPAELYEDLFRGHEEKLGIVHAQISPGGDGLHIVFIPRIGNSIEEAQEAFAADSGLQFWDKQCKDIGRMLFLSSTPDTLYDALDVLVDE